jgi:hypothetical protein
MFMHTESVFFYNSDVAADADANAEMTLLMMIMKIMMIMKMVMMMMMIMKMVKLVMMICCL